MDEKTQLLKNAIEFAQKNPEAEQSKELRRRIEAGYYNREVSILKGETTDTPVVEAPVPKLTQFAAGIAREEVKRVGQVADLAEKFTSQTAGRVLNLVRGKGFTPTEPRTGMLKDVVGGEEKFEQLTTPQTPIEQAGANTEKIAEFLAPTGIVTKGKGIVTGLIKGKGIVSNLLKTGAKSAIEAGTVGAQTALQEGEINDNVKTASIVSALFPVAGGLLKTAGAGIKGIGQKIQQSVIKPSIADVKDGFKVETLSKYNLGGSLDQTLAKANAKMNDISSQLKEKLKDSVVPVNLNSVYENTEKRLLSDKAGNFGDNAGIQKVLNNLKGEIADVAGQNGLVDLLEANIIKRGAGTKGSWVFGNADPDSRAVEKVYNTFYNVIKTSIEEAAEKSGQGGIKDLNKQLSELIPISNAVLRRIPIAERNNALSLTDVISITGSFFDPRALVLTGVNKLSKSGKVGELLTKAGSSLKEPNIKDDLLNRLLGN